MTKFEFQTGDKVLARVNTSNCWCFHHFSHMDGGRYVCEGWGYEHCIPYNETTKHLCGTSDPYIDPAEAPAFEFGDVVRWVDDGRVKRGIFCTGPDEDWECEVVEEGDSMSFPIKIMGIKLIRKGNFND